MTCPEGRGKKQQPRHKQAGATPATHPIQSSIHQRDPQLPRALLLQQDKPGALCVGATTQTCQSVPVRDTR